MKKVIALILIIIAAFFTFQYIQKTSTTRVYGIIGDAGKWHKTTEQGLKTLHSLGVKKLILPGDNLYNLSQTYSEVWAPWTQLNFIFDIVAIGNHTNGYKEEVAFFNMPNEFYSRTDGSIQWIVLNSDNTANVSEQMALLRASLESVKDKLVFIVYHHPTYTVTDFHKWTEKESFQTPMRELLMKYQDKITALIVGHDHTASIETINDLPMIVSGAIQDQRSARKNDYQENDVHVLTHWFYKGEPTVALLKVEEENRKVSVDFFETQNKTLSCSAQIYPRPIILDKNCAD